MILELAPVSVPSENTINFSNTVVKTPWRFKVEMPRSRPETQIVKEAYIYN